MVSNGVMSYDMCLFCGPTSLLESSRQFFSRSVPPSGPTDYWTKDSFKDFKHDSDQYLLSVQIVSKCA